MDDPRGTIVAFVRDENGERAIVDVDAGLVCPRCAAGRGCGAGLLSGPARNRRVEARITPGLDLREGDTVRIELAGSSVLRAAVLVYGVPLAGAAIAATMAYLLGLGDVGAAAMAIAGLGAGFLAGRLRLDRQTCLSTFTPMIAQRIRGAG